MTRDWIWGWAAALPTIIVAFLAIKSIGLFSERPSIAAGIALALATTISTGMLWLKNRHSLLKITQSGGHVELLIRPIHAFFRAAFVFPAILGLVILPQLVVKGRVIVESSLEIIVIGLAAYLWSLNDTAYKNPND